MMNEEVRACHSEPRSGDTCAARQCSENQCYYDFVPGPIHFFVLDSDPPVFAARAPMIGILEQFGSPI